jgi:hypothetical protein
MGSTTTAATVVYDDGEITLPHDRNLLAQEEVASVATKGVAPSLSLSLSLSLDQTRSLPQDSYHEYNSDRACSAGPGLESDAMARRQTWHGTGISR